MIRVIFLTVLSSLLMTGCVLQGVPRGLTREESKKIETGNLDENLSIARDVTYRWQNSRDAAERYTFWSNAALIPLAAGGAAAAVYKGSKDLLAGIGLAAGTLVGTNSFIGASSIASAYQAGMNGMTCVTKGLAVYGSAGTKPADASVLEQHATALEAQTPQASAVLNASTQVDMSSAAANAERVSNPGIVTALATNEKALTQAIGDAQNAAAAARTELHLFKSVAGFARDRIVDVNQVVAGKIKPGTVNYSTLSGSILSSASGAQPRATPASAAVTPPTAPQAGWAKHPATAPATPSTPIADAAKNSKAAADDLVAASKKLSVETSDFDLSTQENTINTCVKNL